MNYPFTVEFFWKGERKTIQSQCEHWPANDVDASGIATLAIQSWFESQDLPKAEIIRNVDLVTNQQSNHWDVLQL